ncbi:MAG: amidase [Nonomuraea sp.]|nr:amidase [Nonomuraea sp.]
MNGLARETRWMDATDQARLVRSGEVTALELVDAAIERVTKLNPALNAVVMEWYDHARGLVAGGGSQGPFAGVPFLLKDFMAPYAGQTMSNGNRRLKELALTSDADSTLVARFRAAGLITVGRTNTPEFAAMGTTEPKAWGPTRNPWNPAYSTGGSSGGATAAVAAGMVPVAHASDGSGSIRIPAALSGLVGLKPSRGRITAGPFGDEWGPAVSFAVSRTVRDTAALLDAVAGPDVGDLVVAPAPDRPYLRELDAAPGALRIGVLDRLPSGDAVHDDCATAVREAAALLEELGHRVEPAFPPILGEIDVSQSNEVAMMAASPMLGSFGHLAGALGRELRADDMEPLSWASYLRAKEFGAGDLLKAYEASVRYRRQMQQWWAGGFDLLLTPTTADPAPPIGSYSDDWAQAMTLGARYVVFTRPFNITGQPAISLPLYWNGVGLPVGVQFAAAYGREDLLLTLAAQLEQARPWAHRTPPTAPR